MIKKILVTGGSGFIGSHLCEKLVKDKKNIVYSLDNYFTGSQKNHIDGVIYIKGSTTDIDRLIDFIPDIIYHLGEYSRVEQSFDDIEKVWSFNKNGTFAVLEFVKKTGTKIVYAGSSTKFGDGGLGRDQSPYAWSKATNTELVKNYGNWFNISYAIVYFYNVYGEREISKGKYATFIGILTEKMKENKTVDIVSPGTQKRNFTHVYDIIDGLILVGNDGYGDDFGIGSSEAYTVLEVANMFDLKINMVPARKGNRMLSDLITDKIRCLGWKPQYKLKDYVEKLKNIAKE